MKLQQYQKLALRTESIVDDVAVNKKLLIETLQTIVQACDTLDGIKKSIYYADDSKLAQQLEKDIIQIDSRILHGIIGITTESGELVQALLANLVDDKKLDIVNIHEEMHDISWYMAILHDVLKLSWMQGLINNIQKLRKRFPLKFTNINAKERNLLQERVELEKQ